MGLDVPLLFFHLHDTICDFMRMNGRAKEAD